MKRTKTVVLMGLLLLTCLAPLWASAQSRMAGTWKENEAKRVNGGGYGLRFRLDAQGKLEELRGSNANPLVQPVRFDGKLYPPDNSAAQLSWKQVDKNRFERTFSQDGKLINTRRIQISADGKTLTEDTEQTLVNGKRNVITITYQRTSGDATQSLLGIWKFEKIHNTVPVEFKLESVGPDRFKWSDDAGVTYTFALDNKPVSVTGPAIIEGTMTAYKQVDANTFEQS